MNAPVPSLRRNIVHSMLGTAAFAASQFLIVLVVARLGTPDEVGALTLATALATPFFLFAQMGLRDGYSVDDLDYFTRADYAALRWLTSGLAFLIVALLAATLQQTGGWLVQTTTLAVAALRVLDSQANMSRSIYQRAERMDYVALSMLLQGSAGLAAFAVVYWPTRNLPLAVLAQAVSVGIWVLLYDQGRLNRLDARIPISAVIRAKPEKIAQLFWWMLPLGLAVFAASAAISAPAIVLDQYADLATVGQFGAILYFGTAATLLANAVGLASSPRLRRLYKAGNAHGFRRLALRLTAFSGTLGVAIVLPAWLFGDQILGTIYGERYRQGDLFALAMLGFALRITGTPFQSALSAGQAFRRRFSNTAVAFVASVVTAVVLIPDYGAYGAAAALVAAGLANLVLTGWACFAVSRSIPALKPSDDR